MSSHAGKLYIAHCPKCSSLLKDISPIPLYRCRACNSFLLVKHWKLEDTASIKNTSSAKHTSEEKSENSGLISEDGSMPTCSEIRCDGEKEETFEKSGSLSSQDESEKGSGQGEAAANDMLTSTEEGAASLSNKTDSLCVDGDIEDWKENEEDDLAKREDECDDDEPSSFSDVMAPSKEADPCHLKANFIEMANGVEQGDKCQDWEGGHMENPKNFSPKHASESGSDLTDDALSERRASNESSARMKDANALGIIWSDRGGERSGEAPPCPPDVNVTDLNHVEAAGDIPPTAVSSLSDIPSNRKPVSMRTFRCQNTCGGSGNIPADGEEAKAAVFAVENVRVVSKAADQSSLSLESHGLNSPAESMLYQSNHEFSARDPILTSHPEDEEASSDVSSNVYYSPGKSASDENGDAVCKATVNSPPPSDICILTPTPKDEVSIVPPNGCLLDESIFADKNVDVVSTAAGPEQNNLPPSESSCSSLTTGCVISPRNHREFPGKSCPLTSRPDEDDAPNVYASDGSLENGTEPKNDSASTIKPKEGGSSAANQQSYHPSEHQELLQKLDELKDDIIKSMERRRKGNRPRSTGDDAAEMTDKPLVSRCDFGQENRQQLLASPHWPLKASRSTKSLHQKQVPMTERRTNHRPKHQAESNQDIISPSSSASSSTPVTGVSTCKGPQLCSGAMSPQHYRGNRKVGCEQKRRARNREKGPLGMRYCRSLLGGAPYVVCYRCMNLLRVPEVFQFSKRRERLQCGSCLKILKLTLLGQTHMVPWSPTLIQSSMQHR